MAKKKVDKKTAKFRVLGELILQNQDKIKLLYEENERLMSDVIDLLIVPQEITFEYKGETYELRDNFADTNVVFRAAAVKRFEVLKVKKGK